MRIAFYAPMKPPSDPTPSGDRRMARLFIEALEQAGASVRIASTFRSYDRGDRARQGRIAAVGGGLARRLVRSYRAGPAAARPEVWFTYHLYHKAPDHIGPVVAEALAIPYVVAEASFAPKQAGGPFDLGHRAAAGAIAAADRIYCLNPVDAACLRPLVADPRVLDDLPPFLDTAAFRRPAAARRTARAKLAADIGIDARTPLILAVAMMRADQKLSSYHALGDALALVGERPWHLVIVGDGTARGEVAAVMRRFGTRVSLLGERDGAALPEIYGSADIFAWPAVKEAFGMVFLEAAASGLAIVAGRSGGIEHVVDDGETGLIVPAGDPAAMAQAILRLLDDPALMAAMGAKAAERALRVNDIAAAASYLRDDLAALVRRDAWRAAP